MQFTITINQAKALEWKLNAQQALLFAFVYECPSWARMMKTDDGEYYALSKSKVIEELPILTDKPDTVYRLMKQLESAGLVDVSHTATITLIRITRKGKEWNRKIDGSEKYPTSAANKVGKISEARRKKIRSTSEKNPMEVGKISEPRSEKSPTNQGTSNQVTNQGTSQVLPVAVAAADSNDDSEAARQAACRSIWSAYSMAYQDRYHTPPVRNAKVNKQVIELNKRLGAEAPAVADYFVSINDAFLIRNCHDVGSLLAKAESYRTQWATNTQVTGRSAQQVEKTQSNVSAAQAALNAQRARRAANADA